MRLAAIVTAPISIRYLLKGQLSRLADEGWRIDCVASAGDDWLQVPERFARHLVSFTRRVSPLHDIRAAAQLWRILRRQKPDIVHTHTPKANLLGQLVAAAATPAPRVCTFHGLLHSQARHPFARAAWTIFEWIPARLADHVFLVTEEDQATLAALPGLGQVAMSVLPGGVGVDLGPDLAPEARRHHAARLRRELGLPDGPLLGFVGRLTREKGLQELFSAYARVLVAHPSTSLVIVGPVDRDRDDSFDAVTAAGAFPNVRLLGQRDDVPDLLRAMSLLVHPSYREGLPVVLMEAAAAGIPAVATAIRGCRDVVTDAETGLLVPPHDDVALARAIERLLCDEQEASRMGRTARRRAEQRFGIDRAYQANLAVYEALIAGRRM